MHRAVFFDRDETIIEDPGFISDPAQVVLRPGAAEAIRRVRESGHRVIVVSNQSGVARGLITEEDLARVHDRLRELLGREGAEVDAIYYCPFLEGPEATVERYRRDSELRKPRPGMLLQAAREWDLDLAASWMIGDRDSDVQAGRAAGCRTIRLGLEPAAGNGTIRADRHVASILEAARIVEEDQRQSDTSSNAPSREDARQLLGEIRDAVTRLQRKDSQEDFSIVRLIGSLTQMLALVVAIWGTLALFNDNEPAAIARYALAGFLQLLTLTVYIASRKP